MHARRVGIVKKVCFEKELGDTNVCGGKELLPFQSQIKWNRRNIANYIVNLKIKEQTKTCSWPSITVNTIELRANGMQQLPTMSGPWLLRYTSKITEQKKLWELVAEKFDRF